MGGAILRPVMNTQGDPVMFKSTHSNRSLGVAMAFGLLGALLLVAATLVQAVDGIQAYV